MEIDAKTKLRGQIDAAVISITNSTPSIAVTAMTDGKFVVDWGWTKVPKVGLTVTQHLPVEASAPIVLCDNRALPSLDFSLKEGTPIVWKETGRTLFMSPRLGDFSIETATEGILIGTVPHLEPSSQFLSTDDWKKRRDDLQVRAVAQWEKENGQMKMGETTIAVHVGDIEFGPNNDLVVFLRSLGKAAEDIVKMLKDVGEEVSPEKIRGWLENPGESVARSDAGKLAQKVEGEAKAAAEKAAAEAKRVIETAAAEAKRIADDAAGAAKKAGNWMSKRIGVKW